MATYSSIKKKKERKKENILLLFLQFSSVQTISHVQLFGTPWTAAHQATLSFTISQSFLKLMSIELVMPSNHLVLHHPLLFLPSIFPSTSVFPNELTLQIRWPKQQNFSFSNTPSKEYPGLISFRIDQFDLLAVQVTPKSQSKRSSSSRPLILWIFGKSLNKKGCNVLNLQHVLKAQNHFN